jgi:hypothetical protein
MQVKFTTEEKLLVDTIFQDIIEGTTRANDKATKKYAKRLQNKFGINNEISHIKLNEVKILTMLLIEFLESLKESRNVDEKLAQIMQENITLVELFIAKLTTIVVQNDNTTTPVVK